MDIAEVKNVLDAEGEAQAEPNMNDDVCSLIREIVTEAALLDEYERGVVAGERRGIEKAAKLAEQDADRHVGRMIAAAIRKIAPGEAI